MSKFTRNRLIERKNKQKKHDEFVLGWQKFNNTMNKMIDVMKVIEQKYPNYELLSDEEKLKIFQKEYDT